MGALNAKWFVHRDEDGRVSLQIELGEDYAVVVGCSQAEGASVSLYTGSGYAPLVCGTPSPRLLLAGGKRVVCEGYSNHDAFEVLSGWVDQVVMSQKVS